MAAQNPITTAAFNGDVFPESVYPALISSIIEANQFAASLTRYPSGSTTTVFGIISAMSGAAWLNETDPKPDILTDSASLVVTAQELAGIAMVSDRAVRDSNVDLLGEVQRNLRTYFGRVLDDGLLHGDAPPEPTGVFSFAAASSGADLWTAVHQAKADLITGGGTPTTLALPPAAIVAEEGRLDGNDRPLYDNGLSSYAGLDVVPVAAMAASEGLVYDRSGCYLVVAEDFRIVASRDYAPAFQRDSVALRVSGQFAVAVPVPAASIRKLTVTAQQSRTAKKA
jgi:HK97 family phage major capsid protein